MKVREVMSKDPICCVPSDKAQNVAKILRDRNVGSLPVVTDQQAHKLVGMITDRDLCCTIIADGLDPRNTTIEKFISVGPVTCRDGENVEKCERAMQEHQLRRIPVVDAEGNCIWNCVSGGPGAERQARERVSKTVAEISKPESTKAA